MEEEEFPVMLVAIIAAAVVALCCIGALAYVCIKRSSKSVDAEGEESSESESNATDNEGRKRKNNQTELVNSESDISRASKDDFDKYQGKKGQQKSKRRQ